MQCAAVKNRLQQQDRTVENPVRAAGDQRDIQRLSLIHICPQTVTGVVVDASMNNIMVRTDAGDTVDISTMDTDPAKVPGVLIDDSVRVVCAGKDVDGVKVLTAQELTVTVHSPY